MEHAPIETPERKAFYARIDKQNMTPLWSVINALITPEPRSACVPALWRFDEIRKAMLEAGALITAKEAERRGGAFSKPPAPRPRQETRPSSPPRPTPAPPRAAPPP